MSETPLSDAVAVKRPLIKRPFAYVRVSDCRAIELRLNECVEALERYVDDGYGVESKRRQAQRAIANARMPL